MPKTIDSFFGPYRFLSNFYPVELEMDGSVYPTLEHAYQAAKSLDPFERKIIREATTPGEAKRRGRAIVHSNPQWGRMRLKVMRDLLRQKFSKDPFRQWLLDTQDAILIEGNTWGDTFWGVFCGKGENHLGKLLMEVRDEIRRGAGSAP